MTGPETPPGGSVPLGGQGSRAGGPADRSPWHWLLWLPLVVVLIPEFYNRTGPRFIGIPFFYWYQLATIAVGVACTTVVYLRTRR